LGFSFIYSGHLLHLQCAPPSFTVCPPSFTVCSSFIYSVLLFHLQWAFSSFTVGSSFIYSVLLLDLQCAPPSFTVGSSFIYSGLLLHLQCAPPSFTVCSSFIALAYYLCACMGKTVLINTLDLRSKSFYRPDILVDVQPIK